MSKLPRIDVTLSAFFGAVFGLLLLVFNAYTTGALTGSILFEPTFTVLILVVIQFGVQYLVRARQLGGKIATGAVAGALWLIIQAVWTAVHGDPIIDTASVIAALTLVATTVVAIITPSVQVTGTGAADVGAVVQRE